MKSRKRRSVPRSRCNVVSGVGEVAGAALAAHTDVARVDFTGGAVGGAAVGAAVGRRCASREPASSNRKGPPRGASVTDSRRP